MKGVRSPDVLAVMLPDAVVGALARVPGIPEGHIVVLACRAQYHNPALQCVNGIHHHEALYLSRAHKAKPPNAEPRGFLNYAHAMPILMRLAHSAAMWLRRQRAFFHSWQKGRGWACANLAMQSNAVDRLRTTVHAIRPLTMVTSLGASARSSVHACLFKCLAFLLYQTQYFMFVRKAPYVGLICSNQAMRQCLASNEGTRSHRR